MYISPIEASKFNNLDIRITYEGYSLKTIIWSEMSNIVVWYVSSFANQLFISLNSHV